MYYQITSCQLRIDIKLKVLKPLLHVKQYVVLCSVGNCVKSVFVFSVKELNCLISEDAQACLINKPTGRILLKEWFKSNMTWVFSGG